MVIKRHPIEGEKNKITLSTLVSFNTKILDFLAFKSSVNQKKYLKLKQEKKAHTFNQHDLLLPVLPDKSDLV